MSSRNLVPGVYDPDKCIEEEDLSVQTIKNGYKDRLATVRESKLFFEKNVDAIMKSIVTYETTDTSKLIGIKRCKTGESCDENGDKSKNNDHSKRNYTYLLVTLKNRQWSENWIEDMCKVETSYRECKTVPIWRKKEDLLQLIINNQMQHNRVIWLINTANNYSLNVVESKQRKTYRIELMEWTEAFCESLQHEFEASLSYPITSTHPNDLIPMPFIADEWDKLAYTINLTNYLVEQSKLLDRRKLVEFFFRWFTILYPKRIEVCKAFILPSLLIICKDSPITESIIKRMFLMISLMIQDAYSTQDSPPQRLDEVFGFIKHLIKNFPYLQIFDGVKLQSTFETQIPPPRPSQCHICGYYCHKNHCTLLYDSLHYIQSQVPSNYTKMLFDILVKSLGNESDSVTSFYNLAFKFSSSNLLYNLMNCFPQMNDFIPDFPLWYHRIAINSNFYDFVPVKISSFPIALFYETLISTIVFSVFSHLDDSKMIILSKHSSIKSQESTIKLQESLETSNNIFSSITESSFSNRRTIFEHSLKLLVNFMRFMSEKSILVDYLIIGSCQVISKILKICHLKKRSSSISHEEIFLEYLLESCSWHIRNVAAGSHSLVVKIFGMMINEFIRSGFLSLNSTIETFERYRVSLPSNANLCSTSPFPATKPSVVPKDDIFDILRQISLEYGEESQPLANRLFYCLYTTSLDRSEVKTRIKQLAQTISTNLWTFSRPHIGLSDFEIQIILKKAIKYVLKKEQLQDALDGLKNILVHLSSITSNIYNFCTCIASIVTFLTSKLKTTDILVSSFLWGEIISEISDICGFFYIKRELHSDRWLDLENSVKKLIDLAQSEGISSCIPLWALVKFKIIYELLDSKSLPNEFEISNIQDLENIYKICEYPLIVCSQPISLLSSDIPPEQMKDIFSSIFNEISKESPQNSLSISIISTFIVICIREILSSNPSTLRSNELATLLKNFGNFCYFVDQLCQSTTCLKFGIISAILALIHYSHQDAFLQEPLEILRINFCASFLNSMVTEFFISPQDLVFIFDYALKSVMNDKWILHQSRLNLFYILLVTLRNRTVVILTKDPTELFGTTNGNIGIVETSILKLETIQELLSSINPSLLFRFLETLANLKIWMIPKMEDSNFKQQFEKVIENLQLIILELPQCKIHSLLFPEVVHPNGCDIVFSGTSSQCNSNSVDLLIYNHLFHEFLTQDVAIKSIEDARTMMRRIFSCDFIDQLPSLLPIKYLSVSILNNYINSSHCVKNSYQSYLDNLIQYGIIDVISGMTHDEVTETSHYVIKNLFSDSETIPKENADFIFLKRPEHSTVCRENEPQDMLKVAINISIALKLSKAIWKECFEILIQKPFFIASAIPEYKVDSQKFSLMQVYAFHFRWVIFLHLSHREMSANVESVIKFYEECTDTILFQRNHPKVLESSETFVLWLILNIPILFYSINHIFDLTQSTITKFLHTKIPTWLERIHEILHFLLYNAYFDRVGNQSKSSIPQPPASDSNPQVPRRCLNCLYYDAPDILANFPTINLTWKMFLLSNTSFRRNTLILFQIYWKLHSYTQSTKESGNRKHNGSDGKSSKSSSHRRFVQHETSQSKIDSTNQSPAANMEPHDDDRCIVCQKFVCDNFLWKLLPDQYEHEYGTLSEDSTEHSPLPPHELCPLHFLCHYHRRAQKYYPQGIGNV